MGSKISDLDRLAENLKRITGGDAKPSRGGGDDQARNEEKDLTTEKQRVELRGLDDDRAARVKYAKYIFGLTVAWLCVVIGVVVACGMQRLKLDSKVLLALIGSGSVNVLAFMGQVTGYLFPKKK